MFENQKILPAVRNMKDFETFIKSNYKYGVFLELHLSQLKNVFEMAHKREKKMFLHADLVQGLKNDEYAAEYLCQEVNPYGLISTKPGVILKARQKGVKAIQRIFILDSNALKRNITLIQKAQPDFVEVLPGLIPKIIKEINYKTERDVFAGGLIETVDEVENAIQAGAKAVTTSNIKLWKYFHSF
ncbi:glycerol-3-phosphate responsive antiterminator [Bacillus sp. JCM 19034]|uniref:glycerol-3-phosphate responsive antiterminator n=1 Tax=Bacillus sp. JCM 19034 TaxID=1481928 RepID=UPI0022B18509|nr:glycerol-3-phosphate responsive antiterminator [Bacillus sp. JCM 19034]